MTQPDSTPLPYTPESVRAHMRTLTLGRRVEIHRQVGSTNDRVKEAARRGEPEGLVIAAEEQVTGRGRLGRVWTAPPGCSILCSVLFRPRFSPQQAFYLTAATALAIRRATSELFTTERPTPNPRPSTLVSLKWPNDVLINGRKVAGILSESEFDGQSWRYAVVGFGLNVNLRPEQLGDLQATATSLSAELGHEVDRTKLLCRILEELEGLYFSLQNGQLGSVHSQWSAALSTLGKQVAVQEGSNTLSGKALRVDPDGALVLRLDAGGERRVLAGDVTLNRE